MAGSRATSAEYSYIDSFTEFLALEQEWNALESRTRSHVFQNFYFLRSWFETAGRAANVRLAIVAYRENGVLRAIFPGSTTKRAGFRILTWLGGLYVVDYGDVLYDDSARVPLDEFLDKAFRLLKKRNRLHASLFENVRTDATAYGFLSSHFRAYRSGVAPYIQMAGNFQQYLDTLKVFRKKMKSDTSRQIKRLSALGALKFNMYDHDTLAPDSLIHTFLQQKRARLEEMGQFGTITLPGHTEFIFSEAYRNPSVHMSCLSLGDELIAIHFGYQHKGRMYYYMPSFSADYANYSPGRILIFYLLEHCFHEGIEVFDFTIGSESYKYDWTRDEVVVTNFMHPGVLTKAARYLPALRDPKALAQKIRVYAGHQTTPAKP